MPWIVKLDKEQDFIGRWALEQRPGARSREPAGRLHVANGPVPTEGAAVVDDGGSRSAG